MGDGFLKTPRPATSPWCCILLLLPTLALKLAGGVVVAKHRHFQFWSDFVRRDSIIEVKK